MSTSDILFSKEIELINLKYPFYGKKRIWKTLQITHSPSISLYKVAILMRKLQICAIYPHPETSITSKIDLKYPYLLKNLIIDQPNQVWATDITYIPTPIGFIYLIAIIDWFSRFILSYEFSNTLDTSFLYFSIK